jgi:hypothetical protein
MGAEMSGRTSTADASGRPLSSSADAIRKREARQASKKTSATSVSGRGGGEGTKGNPVRPDSPFAHAGEPLGEREATDQLKYAHVGLAKIMRSEVDLDELDEEFEVAGKNYAYVANHLWTPLRLIVRFVAPLVLLGALVAIWAAILSETPWVHGIRGWWQRRGEEEEQVRAAAAAPPPAPDTGRPQVVEYANGEQQSAPPIPRRPAVIRNLRGLHR